MSESTPFALHDAPPERGTLGWHWRRSKAAVRGQPCLCVSFIVLNAGLELLRYFLALDTPAASLFLHDIPQALLTSLLSLALLHRFLHDDSRDRWLWQPPSPAGRFLAWSLLPTLTIAAASLLIDLGIPTRTPLWFLVVGIAAAVHLLLLRLMLVLPALAAGAPDAGAAQAWRDGLRPLLGVFWRGFKFALLCLAIFIPALIVWALLALALHKWSGVGQTTFLWLIAAPVLPVVILAQPLGIGFFSSTLAEAYSQTRRTPVRDHQQISEKFP
jgi:hypothetical protein